MTHTSSHTSLHPINAGVALGVLVAACAFSLGVIASISGIWHDAVITWGQFYLGFGPTLGGSVIGAVWGFLDGFVGGALFAWLYNLLGSR